MLVAFEAFNGFTYRSDVSAKKIHKPDELPDRLLTS